MDKEQNIEIDMSLLAKYLEGEASVEEAIAIDEWLKDGKNKKLFDDTVRLWNKLPQVAIHQAPDLQVEWNYLNKKLLTQARKVPFDLLPVAAVVIGLIFCSVIILYLVSDSSDQKSLKFITRGHYKIPVKETLPDSSIIVLNTDATIKYAEKFTGNERRLYLKGEAYFDVVPDREKPFVVFMDELRIKVMGTSFNVRKTYHPLSIEVQVASGSVTMLAGSKAISVNKFQTGVYLRGGEMFLKDSFDINSISYATKNFYFNDMPLEEICNHLQKAFGIAIILENDFSQCRVTAQFLNQPVNYILDVISATLNIHYYKSGNTVYLKGNNCN